MILDEIRGYLKSVAKRPPEPTVDAVRDALAALKRGAVDNGDQAEAKNIWRLEQSLKIQDQYVHAFGLLQTGKYYDGWCALERTEIGLHALERHKDASWSDFRLDFIQAYASKWQKLFPYKMFYSPELLHIEELCSVCRKPVLPRAFCGHRAGEIYDGEMCFHIVNECKVLGVSIVDKPEQKYSVLFLTDEKTGNKLDHYRYDLVEYAAKALRNPFDKWDVEQTTRRQPHTRFAHVGRNDQCPCESGKKYKKCCLLEAGVLRPHFQFTFAFPPPNGSISDAVS